MPYVPPEPDYKKSGTMKDIETGKRIPFKIEKEIRLRQTNKPDKIFVLQELTFSNRNKEIRVGYYIVGKKGKMKNKWAWGQFCPFFPRKDLEELIKKAQEEEILAKEP